MAWARLPNEVIFLIFKTMSYLDDLNSKEDWQDVVNWMLVCRSWRDALELHIPVNAPVEQLLQYGSEKLALAALDRKLDGRFYFGSVLKKWLFFATDRCFVRCMERLIASNPPFTLPIYRDYPEHGEFGTLISLAAERKCLPAARLLLDAQASLKLRFPKPYLYAALQVAYRVRCVPIMDVLIMQGAEPHLYVPTSDLDGVQEEMLGPISYAIECDDTDMLDCVVKHVDMDEKMFPELVSPMIRAIRHRNLSMLFHMVIRGWTVNPRRKRLPLPLGEAAALGFDEIVEFLVDWDADVNDSDPSGYTALDRALIAGNESTVDMMLEYHPVICETTFRAVISNGAVKGLKMLIQKGKYTDKKLISYAFCEAVVHDSEELVQVFLDMGISDMHHEATNRHALICAVERNNLRMTQALLEFGKRVRGIYDEKQSAACLRAAILQRNIPMLQLLFSYGARPNVHTLFSCSALQTAIHIKDYEIVRVVLMHGADVNQKTWKGESPLDLALKTGCHEIVAAVLEYGGDGTKVPAEVLETVRKIEGRNEALRAAASKVRERDKEEHQEDQNGDSDGADVEMRDEEDEEDGRDVEMEDVT